MKKRKTVVALAAVAITASLSLALQGPFDPFDQYLGKTESFEFLYPNDATPEEFDDFTAALLNGSALPRGFQILEWGGKVEATVLPGLVFPSGDRVIEAIVRDDKEDINYGEVYVDGQLTLTATRAGGHIADRGMRSKMTVNVQVPNGTPFTAEVRWISDNGVVNSEAIEMD